MKVALIGGIRLNLPALEAVLTHAKRHQVDGIWNVGDTLGDGPFLNETLQKLKEAQILSILGQFDRKILKAKPKKLKKSGSPDKWLLMARISEQLTINNRKYLDSLRITARFKFEGKKILLVNQLPGLNNTATLEMDDQALTEIAEKAKADVIIYSDPNLQSAARKVSNTWFINTGSINITGNKKPQANYSILNIRPGFFQVRQYQVNYTKTEAQWIESNGTDDDNDSDFESNPLELMIQTSPDQESASWPLESLENQNEKLVPVVQLASNCLCCKYILFHSYQVARLALSLFDQLLPLHQYGTTERFWLWSGALLHDIGWIVGAHGHHKIAFNIITNTNTLPFYKRERFIIACLALYHRKSIPNPHHLHFATLESPDREKVLGLTAILRVADGLDRTHQNLVTNLACEILDDTIRIEYQSLQPALEEYQAAMTKGSLLFEEVFHRKLVMEWRPV
jgi:exopolyphosphatase/guanosine-5'-triphosphate,3'-diphosphate pyrophosphatase